MAGSGRRDERKEAFWRRMVRDQERDGLTVRDWCRRHRLQESAFYWWRQQLVRRDAETMFVPVRVMEDPSAEHGGRIEIVLPDQRRVQVIGRVDRQTLADVLAVLALDTTERQRCQGLEARPC